jgi:predicted DNA-binding transcriptional regulator YafY
MYKHYDNIYSCISLKNTLMDKFDRIYALHTLLIGARVPVPKKRIEEELECGHATVERIIKEMRLYLDAPVEYDRNANGYYYDTRSVSHYQLPGLWFNSSELYALLIAHQLLAGVEPGLIEPHIAPLKQKIEKLLRHNQAGDRNIQNRIRIIKMAARHHNPKQFSIVASALIKRQRLFIRYIGRERNQQTDRSVSPQRLVHYRDNWYMDAWCHTREDLRSFSLDCIQTARTESEACKEIPNEELDSYYASSYGIFSGAPKHTAVLKFSKESARWVADEKWHPHQKGRFEPDGAYLLEIPYSDARELTRDILKHGAEVEVLAPLLLRDSIKNHLKKAVEKYHDAMEMI